MSSSSFATRILYDQACTTEEGVNVLTTIYAALWTYPGAITQTTARIRLTCIYTHDKGNMLVHGGTIEKWRNEGWSLIDEYHDDREDFLTPQEFRDRLLNHAHSFLMGISLTDVDKSYIPSDDFPYNPSNKPYDGTPGLHVIDYNKKKNEKKDDKSKKDKTKNKGKDKNDFDWI